MIRVGVILANLGTPEEPTPGEVGKYLREFLSDPLVLDIPAPLRWLLVNAIIVPFRSRSSAKLYRRIWSAEGSPLVVYSKRFAARVQASLPESFVVRAAMRYGEPSLVSAIRSLHGQGIRRFVLSPQYPQYTISTVESTIQAAERIFKNLVPASTYYVVPPFYRDVGFLDAFAARYREASLGRGMDHVVMSFHGIPVRHLRKVPQEACRGECTTCCDELQEANKNCYRAQCIYTAREIAGRAGIPQGRYSVGFQSRLGSGWIQPFTDHIIRDLAERGARRVAVVCPAFTTDCLETLEEITRYGRGFRARGGEELILVPCLNDGKDWVAAMCRLIQATADGRA